METLTTPKSRNLDRFITATGKTEKEYQQWATQVGKQMHINTLDRIICAKLGIYTVAHLPQLPTCIPELMWDEQQIDEHLLANSENPLELARLWKTYHSEARMYVSVESVLAEYLNPFPKTDFEKNGDANWLPDVSKSWFKKTGINLDVQVDEINEVAPIRITMNDVIAFVRNWKPNAYKSPMQEMLERIEERFKAVTTFRIKEYYAEHLMRSSMLIHSASTEEVPF
ncbi:hypothetical protein [Spirosoma sp.]|uniref:hypothetical protein n=1 Tax=Spirosoma sp. TaxID=1899569 RepID=UPI00261B8651|nr:hypothetical protein [Spirosoma sp.]MCX6216392.1 hypothetical protein [Spirosoma sp.]